MKSNIKIDWMIIGKYCLGVMGKCPLGEEALICRGGGGDLLAWQSQMHASMHLQELENLFWQLNRAIWWILLGANLELVMKKKQFCIYKPNSTNCILIIKMHTNKICWCKWMFEAENLPGIFSYVYSFINIDASILGFL